MDVVRQQFAVHDEGRLHLGLLGVQVQVHGRGGTIRLFGQKADHAVMLQHRRLELVQVEPAADAAIGEKFVQVQPGLFQILSVNDAVFQQYQRLPRHNRPGFDGFVGQNGDQHGHYAVNDQGG